MRLISDRSERIAADSPIGLIISMKYALIPYS
jgi:hypothetical protein